MKPDDLPMTFKDAWRWLVALALVKFATDDVVAAFLRGLQG